MFNKNMIKMMALSLSLIALLSASVVAQKQDNSQESLAGIAVMVNNWSAPVKIASIEVANITTPGVWLSFVSAPYTSHNCTVKSGQYRLGGGDANIKEMTSIATAALVNSRNVRVYWGGGCDGGGTNGYPILLGLTLK